jgi:hypothetical protein
MPFKQTPSAGWQNVPPEPGIPASPKEVFGKNRRGENWKLVYHKIMSRRNNNSLSRITYEYFKKGKQHGTLLKRTLIAA